MNKYLDEIIIQQRRDLERQKHSTLDTGIYAGEELVFFEERVLSEDGTKMLLPSDFIEMPEEILKIKYPMEKRPQIIWSNEDSTIDFTFSLLEPEPERDQLQQVRDDFCNTLQMIYPHYVFTDNGMVDGKTGAWYWAEFLSTTINGMLYNHLHVTCWENKLMLGLFHCPVQLQEDWKKIVPQLLTTISKKEKLV